VYGIMLDKCDRPLNFMYAVIMVLPSSRQILYRLIDDIHVIFFLIHSPT